MNKAEERLSPALRLKSLDDCTYIKKNSYYIAYGIFHQSNGGELYVVKDGSGFENLYDKSRFIVVGEVVEKVIKAEEDVIEIVEEGE